MLMDEPYNLFRSRFWLGVQVSQNSPRANFFPLESIFQCVKWSLYKCNYDIQADQNTKKLTVVSDFFFFKF